MRTTLHRKNAGAFSYKDSLYRETPESSNKRGLVRAKKHGTKSGSGAPLQRGLF